MKRRLPIWLMGFAFLLMVGLIVNQIMWVYNSAEDQEEQFNNRVSMALTNIEEKVQNDYQVCQSVGECLLSGDHQYCSKMMCEKVEWETVDSIIAHELDRHDIDLNYNFDFCTEEPKGPFGQDRSQTYVTNMDEVFKGAGIILFLEFPDKTQYLRSQIGPVFISSILFIVFLFVAFVLTYRFYLRERRLSHRTREFINNMTHEFKTPLANISLASRMIATQQDAAPEKLQRYTAIIDEENARMAKNCDDLLEMATVENDKESYSDPLNAHGIIEEIVDSVKRRPDTNDLDLHLELKAVDFRVLGKESFFRNTILNLVDNAIKYSDKPLRLSIRTENVDGLLHIAVADNGPGIEASHLPNIFDKFYRVSQGDKHDIKGFGLGLAYVKMVISRMRGTVQVSSDPGIGTTFNIALPVMEN